MGDFSITSEEDLNLSYVFSCDSLHVFVFFSSEGINEQRNSLM